MQVCLTYPYLACQYIINYPEIITIMSYTNIKISTPEFFNWYVFISICLFVANNFWLKGIYGNWWTGKISDFTFCFFFPLYLSALISLVSTATLKSRVVAGALFTLFVFSAVKLSSTCSGYLNNMVSPMSEALFYRKSLNTTDASDLIASPCILISIYFVQRRI